MHWCIIFHGKKSTSGSTEATELNRKNRHQISFKKMTDKCKKKKESTSSFFSVLKKDLLMMDQELSKFKFIDDFLSDCMCSKTACNMSRIFFSFCIVVLNDYCCHKCTHCYKSHFFVPKVRTKIQVTILVSKIK